MEILGRYRQMFEKHLQTHQPEGEPDSLYEPARYILDLGGKRLRPVFVLMGCEAWAGDVQQALKAAMAVELFHNFTLLHDDIMDEAELRRGRPTVNNKFGINAGILSGDVMMIMAYQQLLDLQDDALTGQMLKIFNKMAFEVCEGQQMDMDFEKRTDVSITEYLGMITLKTSVLIGAAVSMGAVIGGADPDDQGHIYEFAKNYGVAFQLQDDVLDTFGDPGQVGKKIGGDILRNKKTYLFLKSLELAGDKERAVLMDLYTGKTSLPDDEKISTVTAIFRSVNVLEYCRQLIEAYRDLAVSHLRATKMSEAGKSVFTDLTDQLIFRNS